MSTEAWVNLWGKTIGAVAIEDGADHAIFQYDEAFSRSGIEVAPLVMPLRREPYAFPELPRPAFHGLPGLLADSLPDKYGNALIDAWLARTGRSPASFNAVERLCYTGSRGMGAIEFAPAHGPRTAPHDLAIDTLVDLASEILSRRSDLSTSLDDAEREEAMRAILSVGTSAGGARAKAVIAWNPRTNVVRSGQIDPGEGFEQWIIKFDGVSGDRDRELEDPKGFGATEYAYAEMADAAGITMSPCRLLEEGGRRHFMTKRFDRTDRGGKLHMQSLGAIAHFDYNAPGAHSYEEAFLVIRRLGMAMAAIEEQYRRMVFNVIARNQDDHVKNIAFLMDRGGTWSLSPAFDVTYAYSPTGEWTSRHQMTVNGKRDGFTRDDLAAAAAAASMQKGRAQRIVDEVSRAARDWPTFAERAGVTKQIAAAIGKTHRVNLT